MIDPNLSNSKLFNPQGFIFQDQFFLTREYGLKCIYLNEIKTIKLITKRSLKINFWTVMISLMLLYTSFNYFDSSLWSKLISIVVIIPLLIFAALYKKHFHTLIVITKNNQLILTKVNTSAIKQTEIVVSEVKDRISSESFSMAAS
ncbi:hypothetical protein [Flavobacterium sp.]|jgi:hypothetical protein|uniref:hypothetical protein n=1 Tax=Flavobacterium sp. TaxID=239 RepID=UPI0037BE8FC1